MFCVIGPITKFNILDISDFTVFLNAGFQPILLADAAQATTTILAVLVVVLLVLSFFISGAKIAFFSLNYRDINLLKTKQEGAWKKIAHLLEEPKSLMAALLIANGLVNIAIIILSNLLIDQVIPFKADENSHWIKLLVKVPVITALIILFGEVLPKIRAAHNHLRTAYETASLIEILYYLFRTIGNWLLAKSESVERFLGGSVSRAHNQKRMEEAIKSTVDEEDEQRILAGIYKFRHITVKQIMKTRLDVSGISSDLNFAQVKHRIEELHYSRLPVYKNSLDDIAGMIHTKDVLPYLQENEQYDWHSLMRQPYFVHEQKFIEDLLKEFQSKRIHFAVVVDEFGGTSGIVTMEDILEEIVGEIKDEFDEDESGSRKLEDGSYILEGKMMIHDALKLMDLAADTFDELRGESDSIAGLMLEVAGEIPKVNDKFIAGDFEFTILEVDRNRIQKVKVTINLRND